MSYDQTKDILQQAEEFHHLLHQYYTRLKEKSEREKVKLLLDYIAGHEKRLEEAIARFEEDTRESVRETWIQYTPSYDLTERLKELEIKPLKSLQEAVDLTLKLDEHLIDKYEMMVNTAPTKEVRQVFENLLEMTRQKSQEVVRNTQRLRSL